MSAGSAGGTGDWGLRCALFFQRERGELLGRSSFVQTFAFKCLLSFGGERSDAELSVLRNERVELRRDVSNASVRLGC